MTTERRRFIVKAGGAMAAVAAAAIVDAPNVIAQPKVQWRMSTTWPPVLDQLQGAAERLAKIVEETSGGRFRIEVFPGGQIMQPFECFDAASQGKIEAFMGAPSYWWEKEPAIEWFNTVPFGMNPRAGQPGTTKATGSSFGRRPTPLSTSCRAPARRLPRKWGMVPEEDQHRRRLQRAEDASW